MTDLEHWHIYVCREHGKRKPLMSRDCPVCGGEMERVKVVRAPVAPPSPRNQDTKEADHG